jgi:hypothetical protein
MSKTFEQGKAEVAKLCAYFQANRDEFRARNEAQIRQQLIDPLFEALGWDVGNAERVAPQYAEVLTEQSLDDEGPRKAPDYTFRLGTLPKFYAEAKRCSINISSDPAPAFQLRRYGWNPPGLSPSLLTNFEELGVYDCTIRPRQSDKASRSQISLYRFHEYPDRWRELWEIFSREAVWSGAFDQYAASKRKRGTSEFDAEFLKEIEGWRDTLAKNIAPRNKALSSDDLNAAVQVTIDRVVFLRMAEDRGLEPYGQLLKLCERAEIYPRFMRNLCRKADEKYNSGLFHFEKEEGVHEAPDRITPKLTVDDKVLKPILQSLYFEYGSPYDFRLMPVEILGTIYEQFLGKVIRLTAGHHAKVEEKPEVRAANGVHYTPRYIAEYIVEHTVGRQIEARSPAQLAGGKGDCPLRALDMACGSGSFLLAAYRRLLDYCLKWYTEHKPETYKKAVYQDPRTGQWRLTIAEKKRILTAHIFGVDIDAQAVEVTKLSLLLKVLEGETDQSVSQQQQLFHDRALPSLADNIKCGNSLIGPDYFTGKLNIDPEEMKRINPFDWKQGFPDAMKAGGFDCIIGNPPYRRELDYKELMDEIAGTPLGRKYRAPRMDLWYYFVHRGLELLKPVSLLSFIVNAYWTAGTGAEKLISTLRETTHIDEIFSFGKLKVFQKVSGQHMVIRITNATSSEPTTIKLAESSTQETAEPFVSGVIPPLVFTKRSDQLFLEGKVDIQPSSDGFLSKLGHWAPLTSLGIVRQGIAENPASINKKTNAKYGNRFEVGEGVFALRPDEVANLRLPKCERELLRPYHDLCDVDRYYLAAEPSLNLIYSTPATCPNIREYPTLCKHLSRFRPIMAARRETQKGTNHWWHLHWPRDEGIWKSAKLLSVQMGRRPAFVPATRPVYVPFSVNVFVPDKNTREHLNYITGVLNSRVVWKWFQHYAKSRGAGLEINGNVLGRAPIRAVDFSDSKDIVRHDRIVSFVNDMLALHARIRAADSEQEKIILQRQMEATDMEIDRLVYDLYGLTAEEIAIVEESAK